MAKTKAVWGIDIGQCALKAIRCTLDGETVVADKFDYVEYPKILSQAGDEQTELVREALEQFVSRNDLKGDSVAISVPGQAGLSRFFKPPPVDAKTLPDIVKYEVKQQIPFPIEDVIWDWQRLGGSIIDDVTVDAEVGLFAMKRDAVFRALQPFTDQGIEVDLVQLGPLATYNVVCHDLLGEIPEPDEIDPDNPPESVVVLAIGTETTDLIVTNGAKLWLRNVPIGGNHFTKQLARELKLTYAKAELLKRNARQAEDPKTVFQAMRPVFNDLVTEIQRSLTFFQSMEKNAKIGRIALFGNAAKLPGLRQFLNKQLNMDIVKLTKFKNLTGAEVIEQSSFEDNLLAMAPAYGLCVQGLDAGRLKTNLLPEEFVTERMVRAKKPWVLASVAALALAFMLSWIFASSAWYRVNYEKYSEGGFNWSDVGSKITTNKARSQGFLDKDKELTNRLRQINDVNDVLVSAADGKYTWMEMFSTIYQALPKDPRINSDSVDPMEIPFEDRKEIFIDHIETKYYADLEEWFKVTKPVYDQQYSDSSFGEMLKNLANKVAERNTKSERESVVGTGNFASEFRKILYSKSAAAEEATAKKPKSELSGEGFVIEIKGHHFHNSTKALRDNNLGRKYVLKTFVKNLIDQDITLPPNQGGADLGTFKSSDLGIYFPTFVARDGTRDVTITVMRVKSSSEKANVTVKGKDDDKDKDDEKDKDGEKDKEKTDDKKDDSDSKEIKEERPSGTPGLANLAPVKVKAKRFDFVVQFAWKPRAPDERIKARKERIEKESKAFTRTGSTSKSQPETPPSSPDNKSDEIKGKTGDNKTGDNKADDEKGTDDSKDGKN